MRTTVVLFLSLLIADMVVADKTKKDLVSVDVSVRINWRDNFGGSTLVDGNRYLCKGKTVAYELVWSPQGKFSSLIEQPRVFVHFIDQFNKVVLTDDHDLPEKVWKEGLGITYKRYATIPVSISGRRVTVRVGVYDLKTSKRLILRDGSQTLPYIEAGPFYVYSTFDLNYFSGWYEREVTSEGNVITWMARKGECSFRNPHHNIFLHLKGGRVTTCITDKHVLTVSLNDQEIKSLELTGETFDTYITLTSKEMGAQSWNSIYFSSNQSFAPASCLPGSEDTRELAVYFEKIELSAIHYVDGWYTEETGNNKQWRWTCQQATAQFFNPNAIGELLIDVSTQRTCLSEDPNITIMLNNKQIDLFALSSKELRRTISLTPADFGEGDLCDLKFVIDKTFSPSECQQNSDVRKLGIMVSKIEFVQAESGQGQ